MNVMSEERARLVVWVPRDVHRVLRLAAAEAETTMGELVADLVRGRYKEQLARLRKGKKDEAGDDG
jgi:hypothetical protein